MESRDSSPPRLVNERVYVAVGSDVEESRLTLQWALENFGADFGIIHVRSPSPDTPRWRYPLTEDGDSCAMEDVLDEYIHICHQAEVSAEARWIEMSDIGKGIVELIEQHAVEKLVMGGAADEHYTEGMTGLKSSKAKYVDQHAHPSCNIWFICNGHRIYFREGDLSTIDMDSTSSRQPARSGTVQSYPRNLVASAHSVSSSSEIEDVLCLIPYKRGEGSSHPSTSDPTCSYEEDGQPALLLEGNGNDDLYEQLERAMMEAANAKREAFEELLRRQKAEKNAIEVSRRAKVLEKLYCDELRQRKELQEALAKEKESFETFKNQQTEERSASSNCRTILEGQIATTNHTTQELQDKIAFTEELLEVCKKEQEELQVCLENALKVNEELLTSQGGEASTSQRQQGLLEFSFSEIQEATNNFDPSSKLEEAEYGSIYRGVLRHTPVTIKMLHPDSYLGPSQYHPEVEVMSKLRHPNLVALIGVCPDAWALIYEHLPNGSLEDRLRSENNFAPLSWQNRLRISTEICSALIFLHSCNPDRIVHGDLKPKNILLDANLVSKLKDLRIQDQNPSRTSSENGNNSSGEFSVESDVYSLGIILLQLLTGRSAPDLAAELHDVLYALYDGNINDMLDETAGDWPFLETTQLARLALSCCEMDRNNQPDLIAEVWTVLESIRACCEVPTTSPSQSDPNETTETPSYLICPIYQEIMEDPHVAADGFTYEASAIRGWLNGGHDTSPMTNLQLPNGRLIPNRTLRTAIQEWLQNHQ
ncbi:U-box domain-containing protein 33-like isoform X4 [Punica granatum]|uniref:RING-type E3 ubiquitin transferase n=1 Tax=Punica granatum TaxID=22663 RepID=A0A6P8C395_PUNGR|nr:U-box domain-containing protein 33-like isoform X4 [Punica granatum]